jgi:hypothetical protein
MGQDFTAGMPDSVKAYVRQPAFDAHAALCVDVAARLNALLGGAWRAVAVNGWQAGYYVDAYPTRPGPGGLPMPGVATIGNMQGPWGLDWLPGGHDSHDVDGAMTFDFTGPGSAFDGPGAAALIAKQAAVILAGIDATN